jgi:hypothetical protein
LQKTPISPGASVRNLEEKKVDVWDGYWFMLSLGDVVYSFNNYLNKYL